jgi:hypothetical protein
MNKPTIAEMLGAMANVHHAIVSLGKSLEGFQAAIENLRIGIVAWKEKIKEEDDDDLEPQPER